MTRTTVRYGTRRGQLGELWLPTPASSDDVPVVVLIHGGFWRAQYTKVLMRRLAHSVVAQGWAAWNIEYRRVGPFGGGGGWPQTLADVAAAVDALGAQRGVDLDRVITCGHSAGGHLALWAGARPRLAPDAPGSPVNVPVRAAVSLAGVVDLRVGYDLGLGGGAVAKLLGGAPDAVPDRYECASPVAHLPLGIRQVLIHGLDDTTVPPSMSERYVATAVEAGDDAVFDPVPGVGHSDMLAPNGPAWTRALGHFDQLLTS